MTEILLTQPIDDLVERCIWASSCFIRFLKQKS